MTTIPRHRDLHPGRNVYLTSWFIVSVLYLKGGDTSVVPPLVRIPNHRDPGRNVYPTSWIVLLVLFLTGGETSVFPTCVWDPHHTELLPGRNVYQISLFILSVLFLTGGEVSVVPTHIRYTQSHRSSPWYECLADQLVHSVCVVFHRW